MFHRFILGICLILSLAACGGNSPGVPTANVPAAGQTAFVNVRGAGPGGTAAVSVRTAAGAQCRIVYITPAGTDSSARGLGAKNADGSGNASWSWEVGTSTRPGTGRVGVTCGSDPTVSSEIAIR